MRKIRNSIVRLIALLKQRKCVQCENDLGTLYCFDEYWICENCAQINSELGNEFD